jgi:hypothetical protein
MLARKKQIKIVKRGERSGPPPRPAPTEAAGKKDAPKDFSRDVTSTVAGWVREFQQSRRGGLSRVKMQGDLKA